ncbi:MAG TPA: hypothetical protein VFW87_12810 [Pirellulales bacterium]|nr:hypothetical protein [Pirellulales bacterium]
MSFRAIVCVMVALAAMRQAPAAELPGPEIYNIQPNEAAAGDVVRITGDDLGETREVIFCVGSTTKRAAFEVVSDRDVDVVVPDYFLPGRTATVAVVTPRGATVGMPPTVVTVDGSRRQHPRTAPFYHVLKDGILNAAGGVTLVESRGTLRLATTPGLVLLKKEALLDKYTNPAGLVLFEPGALFGDLFGHYVINTDEPLVMRVPVRSISASLGIEPFLFKAPPQADGDATGPPTIQSIAPPVATYGGVISLRGHGFYGTKEVLFSNGSHVPSTTAGFQIVSDEELRVEMPDVRMPYQWELFIVVVNGEGATVTLPPRSRVHWSVGSNREGKTFYWQNESECRKSTGGNLFWIGADQVVSQTGGLVFVRNGGRYSASGAGQLFYEPDAILPDQVKKSKTSREVRSLVPSTVPLMFTTLDLRAPGARALQHLSDERRVSARGSTRRPPRRAKKEK